MLVYILAKAYKLFRPRSRPASVRYQADFPKAFGIWDWSLFFVPATQVAGRH